MGGKLNDDAPGRDKIFLGEVPTFLILQRSEFIQTSVFIYTHLTKFVVYKSWTRSVPPASAFSNSGKLHNL